MVRRYLGHMTDPRSRRTNHKAQVLLAHAHWAPGCHAERHYRSREDSARLDRGTGKIKQKLCGSKSGLKFWLCVSNLFATPGIDVCFCIHIF
ncbi:unnamed protein product [Staurois parvus]|uniref:Uncharacterized protein n=1 Tax=Staurois parvus TaxID=386267 RepID=A0ABN9BXT9_9NEOB|nr:unnamed protein product [Staurois parvus]